MKMQVIRLYLKFASVQQIHWIGREIDCYIPNPHTNQPAGLIDMESTAAQQPTSAQHSKILRKHFINSHETKKLVVVQ